MSTNGPVWVFVFSMIRVWPSSPPRSLFNKRRVGERSVSNQYARQRCQIDRFGPVHHVPCPLAEMPLPSTTNPCQIHGQQGAARSGARWVGGSPWQARRRRRPTAATPAIPPNPSTTRRRLPAALSSSMRPRYRTRAAAPTTPTTL